MNPSVLIGKSVLIELVRRKDLYVMGLLVLVFSIGVLSARTVGIENEATGTFLLNLGLTLAYIFSNILTLLLACRQLPSEIENRTIYPILARPVTRLQFLLGKWGACACSGYSAYLLFFAMVWFTNPHLETYSSGLLLQNLPLQGLSFMLVSGLGLLFSLILPKALAVVTVGGLIFAGPLLLELLKSGAATLPASSLIMWVIGYIPEFKSLNLTTRLTDGMGPLTGGGFINLLLYCFMYILFSLMISGWVFERRSL